VEAIVALQQAYPKTEVRLHTTFLAAAGLPPDGAAEVEALLQEMAAAGHGTYQRFNSGAEIDFSGQDVLP
jgi:hypothetical protein